MSFRIVYLIFCTVGSLLTAQADNLLQVRWGGEGRGLMEVRGVDAQDRLRLTPTDGSAGEALVPLGELKDLQFILPDAYREARQRAFVGRPMEAIFLLRDVIPAYAPYAHIPDSNAGAAVQFYLSLLIDQREWADAIALGAALVERDVSARLMPELVRLVRGLQAADRTSDAAWLVGRLPLDHDSGRGVALIRGVADQMRKDGHWAEAQAIYQRLRRLSPREDAWEWDRLIAYTDWHQGSALRTGVLVQENDDQTAAVVEDPTGLQGLLRGRFLLHQGRPREALDALSQTLIGIPAASEWRTEITAVIADAYAAMGDDTKANMIRADLRRMHPDSRWVSSVAKSSPTT